MFVKWLSFSLLSSFIIQNGTNLNLYIHRLVPRMNRREWRESLLKWLRGIGPVRRQLNQSGEWKDYGRCTTRTRGEKLGWNSFSNFKRIIRFALKKTIWVFKTVKKGSNKLDLSVGLLTTATSTIRSPKNVFTN